MLLRCALIFMILLLPACTSRKAVVPPPDGLPAAARKNLEQGYRLAQQQNPAAAIRYFEAARQSAPLHPPLLLNLGLAHGHLGHHATSAAWLNAYLATRASATQRAAIEQQYEREKATALAHTDTILHLALKQLFQLLEAGLTPDLKSNVKLMARDMAGGGDIYGALKLLAEVDRHLPVNALPARERSAWLAEARDMAWQAYAQSLVYTRQGVLADQARGNIQNRNRQDRFWWELANDPKQHFTLLPATLREGLEWVAPLALHYETDSARQQSLKTRIAKNPALYAQPRPALLPRAVQLAVVLSETESRLPAALSATMVERLPQSGAPRAAELAKRACELNTLLFLMRATELERHMDFSP